MKARLRRLSKGLWWIIARNQFLKILWSSCMPVKTLLINTFLHRKPVEVFQGWLDVLSLLGQCHFISFLLPFTGIIHSDLKPANFLLVAGNLKLIDFGIANALQQDKTSVLKDSRVGTPSYMSPEAIMAACDDTGDDSADEKENLSSNRPKYKVKFNLWSLG